MFKNDTMEQYVEDRHPHLAPRLPLPASAIERITWAAACVMQDARERAAVALTRTPAPVFNIDEARIARTTSPSIA